MPTKAVDFNYKHRKQSGGSGQYAHVVGRMVPLPEGAAETFVFVNDITQGRIPKEYISPIEDGLRLSLVKGPLCECEVVGVEVTVTDGSYHDVDSSEMAFRICGQAAMREILRQADLGLLEPIMKLEVEVPEEFQGSVCGHISSKRGLITQTESNMGLGVINAEVPLAEMFDYANELRSMTQGKGSFTMEFGRYKLVPRSLQPEIVERRRADKDPKNAKQLVGAK
jgi:elongation factor G